MSGVVYVAIATAMALGGAMGIVVAPSGASEVQETDTYIVVSGTPIPQTSLERIGVAAPSASDVLSEVLEGFVAELAPYEAGQLDALPGVSVHPDVPLLLADTQSSAPWHLSRLDQASLPLDSQFEYPTTAGSGVRIYVVDTGVYAHGDLSGRILPGYTAVTDGLGTSDCDGHGTHVAGIAASSTYGVAKLAKVVPIRVFGCSGPTSLSAVLDGLDWVAANHPVGTPGVINLSIAGAASSILDQAVNALVSDGFVVTAAAGNGGTDQVGDDACGESPARATLAITVAAIDSNDVRPSFSNYGPCVDLFAPGVSVRSLAAAATGTQFMSGTSMATPLIAGVAALVWAEDPSQSNTTVASRITSGAVTETVTNPGAGSPSRVASLTFLSSVQSDPPGAPEGLAVTANDGARLSLVWDPPADPGGAPITDYVVEYRKSGTSSWTTVSDGIGTGTAFTFQNPTSGTTFDFSVSARNAGGIGGRSTISATIPVKTPSAATGLAVSTNTFSSLGFTWSPPTSVGAGPVTDYVLQYKRSTSSTWTTLADGINTKTSFAFANPAGGVTFDFKVFARNAYGTGPSTTISATTLEQ